jgi:hypothetical protein
MLYEPFHPDSGRAAQLFTPNLYLRPDGHYPEHLAVASRVFEGRYYHPNVDQDNHRWLYRGIVVKDIFAHLFAAWAMRKFPGLKPLLVSRNPFDVALSKLERKEWVWMTDAREFLKQEQLVVDHLEPYVDLIRGSDSDFIQQQVLIWSIIHYVILRQLGPDSLFCIRYEDVVDHPVEQLRRLQNFVRGVAKPAPQPVPLDRIWQPSRGSAHRHDVPHERRVSRRNDLDRSQINAGLRVIEQFDLVSLAG